MAYITGNIETNYDLNGVEGVSKAVTLTGLIWDDGRVGSLIAT